MNNNLSKPKFLYIFLTSECNFHCKHCHMWMNKSMPGELSINEWLKIINQFYDLNPTGNVVITGGEVTLKIDALFDILNLTGELGLKTTVLTNGSLLSSEHYERFLTNGPNNLFFSLDSHKEEIHDYIRGTPGAFNNVVNTIKNLVRLKEERYKMSSLNIFTTAVLFEKNIYEIFELIDFAKKELKTNGINLQCLYETYQNGAKDGSDLFFDHNFFKNKDKAIEVIDKLIDNSKSDSFHITDKIEYQLMKKYIKNPNFKTELGVCDSFDKNIFIDDYGRYSLCTNMHEINEIKSIGNFRQYNLKEFWFNVRTEAAREILRDCTNFCGMFACNRK